VYVCAVLDDSSRRILAGGEFNAETTDNALQLLKEAMDRFGWLTKGHGTEEKSDHGLL